MSFNKHPTWHNLLPPHQGNDIYIYICIWFPTLKKYLKGWSSTVIFNPLKQSYVLNNNKQLKCYVQSILKVAIFAWLHFSDEIKGNFIHLQFCCVWVPSSNILWLNYDERENMFASVVHTNKLIKTRFSAIKNSQNIVGFWK